MFKYTIAKKINSAGKFCIFSAVLFLFVVSCSSQEELPVPDLLLGYLETVAEDTENYEELTTLPEPVVLEEFDWWMLYDFERNSLLRHESVVSPFYGETLTILVLRDWHDRHNMSLIVNGFERMHPGVAVEFVFADEQAVTVTDDYFDFDDMMDELMDEHAPVLIQASTVMYPMHEHTDFFADWMPVLERHPGFSERDWNKNVINASLINGELIAFPAFQHMFFVSANRNFPNLLFRLEFRDGITINELMDLYDELGGYVDGYVFSELGITWQVIDHHLYEFFCYETGRVEFDSQEFVRLLERLRYTMHMLDDEIISEIQDFIHANEVYGDFNFFRFSTGMWNVEVFSILEQEPFFVSPLPILLDDGALMVFAGPFQQYSWILSSHDPVSQALAADFLLYIAGVFGQGVTSRNSPFYAHRGWWGMFGVPARRDAFSHFEYVLSRHVQWNLQTSLRYSLGDATDKIVDYVLPLEQMEMRRHGVMPYRFYRIIFDELQEFSGGTVSADETAARLQSRVMGELDRR